MAGSTALVFLAALQLGQFWPFGPARHPARQTENSEPKPQIVGGPTGNEHGGTGRSKDAGRLPGGTSLRNELKQGQRGPVAQSPAPQQFDPLADDTMRADARLADVCFIDPRRGWAVGDRGAIWHTEDGGRHWQLQPSGVECPLRSVCFLNEQVGWVVGGFAHPYTHTGSGVLLWTRDGGRHWGRDERLLLPALAQVRFFNERQGWAVGCASAMFPAGIFVTQDGGQTWMPPCGAATGGWLAADFLDLKTGVFAGRTGTAATLQCGQLRTSQPGFGPRSLTRVKLVPPGYGWLIGDGGLVMMTSDLGRNWVPPPGAVAGVGAPLFDFAALAMRGPKCWIAGSPGSRVFHTPDAGRTWTAFATGMTIPIRALNFVDDQHGWAVGDLGAILATEDGGRTWQQQRAGGKRAALLAFFAQPEDIPLELLAKHCASDGYLGVVEVLGRRDTEPQPREEVHEADRTHEAVVAVGACGAENCRAGILPADCGAGAGPGQVSSQDGCSTSMQEHLVRQIRLWRPEVIITRDNDRREGSPLAPILPKAIQDAVRKAADPASFAEHIRLAELKPWQVKRVYAVLPPEKHDGAELVTSQVIPRLGRSLEDLAARPCALLDDHFRPAPASIALRLLSGQLSSTGVVPASYIDRSETAASSSGRGDLFAGSSLPSGSEARRALGTVQTENPDVLQRLALRRRHTLAILDRYDQDPQAADRLLAQTDELLRGLDPPSAAQVLYRLADRYHHTGRGDMAAETFQALVDRYPADLFCRPALRWLVQYYAGSETAPRTTANHKTERLSRAVALGQEIERARPDLFADPAVRFPLAAAYRCMGRDREADRLYLADRRGMEHDAWWACAQGEAWLVQPKGPPPKPVLTCVKTTARPKLDGRLDDDVWRQAKPVVLASPVPTTSTVPLPEAKVMVAHDAQFLYIAISCRQAAGAQYPPATGTRTRTRDSDLTGRDRVEIFLDVDRDYATFYRLAIDHRGWAAESCFGDDTWNPKWFIAARCEAGQWTAEAAIPLAELGQPVSPGAVDSKQATSVSSHNVWAVGIQRTMPGTGFQSWSVPASPRVIPEGFGYLVIE